MRTRVLALVLAGSLGAGGWASQSIELSYVGSERQLGPVAYRDPLGAASPDGAWLATTSGLHLYLRPLAGGAVRELGPGTRRIVELVWSPDGRVLYAYEANYERTEWGWFEYDPITGSRQPASLFEGLAPNPGALRHLSFSHDGNFAAAASRQGLWRFDLGTREAKQLRAGAISATSWHPDGTIACVYGPSRTFALDCGGAERMLADQVYDRVMIDTAGRAVFARPEDSGTLDLWESDNGAEPVRLTRFARDAYAPYLLDTGDLVFRVQDYRIFLATVPAVGGDVTTVTTFQSETPSWNRDGSQLAFTYGTWRRIIDDIHYPDIDQHVGTIELGGQLPAHEPHATVRSSYSEDQGMHWSPDGRWIVLHSHADETDDLWLQPSDGSAPAWPITRGGHETGWPRWSSDGRTIIYPTELDDGTGRMRGHLMNLEVDPQSGAVLREAEPLQLNGYEGSVSFADFSSDGRTVFFESNDGIGRRSIRRVPVQGGTPEIVHEFESEQWFSAIAVSPDDQQLVYVAPGSGGHFQLWRIPVAGGSPVQLTFDATDKTQPAWSPTGDTIAFSVFHYDSGFWRLTR